MIISKNFLSWIPSLRPLKRVKTHLSASHRHINPKEPGPEYLNPRSCGSPTIKIFMEFLRPDGNLGQNMGDNAYSSHSISITTKMMHMNGNLQVFLKEKKKQITQSV